MIPSRSVLASVLFPAPFIPVDNLFARAAKRGFLELLDRRRTLICETSQLSEVQLRRICGGVFQVFLHQIFPREPLGRSALSSRASRRPARAFLLSTAHELRPAPQATMIIPVRCFTCGKVCPCLRTGN